MTDSMQKILDDMRSHEASPNGLTIDSVKVHKWADRLEKMMKEPYCTDWILQRMTDDDEQLKTMNLHDVIVLVTASRGRTEVMRVKNGWIYNFFGSHGQSSCFVPEPKERP